MRYTIEAKGASERFYFVFDGKTENALVEDANTLLGLITPILHYYAVTKNKTYKVKVTTNKVKYYIGDLK